MLDGKTSIRADIIDSILRDEDPFKLVQEEAKVQGDPSSSKEELKVSAFVVDIEIQPPVSAEVYNILGESDHLREVGAVRHHQLPDGQAPPDHQGGGGPLLRSQPRDGRHPDWSLLAHESSQEKEHLQEASGGGGGSCCH